MSCDSLVKWALIAFLALTSALIISANGLVFPATDFTRPLVICGVLMLVGGFYCRRRVEEFAISAHALAQIVAFSACYTVTMYCVASLGTPLADDWLANVDAVCGLCIADITAWANGVPKISRLLKIAYDSMLIQTALVIMVLGLTKDRRKLESFVLCFMVSAIVALFLFACVPAEGPFCTYGYEPGPAQQRFLTDFHAMRSGERVLVTWQQAEGLITFPSFHTTWALILAWALRGSRCLFVPASLLNLAVVISTMTTGWHYFADVLGGTLLAAGSVLVASRLSSWLYESDGTPRRVRLPGSVWQPVPVYRPT